MRLTPPVLTIILSALIVPHACLGSGTDLPRSVSDLDAAFIQSAEANHLDVRMLRAMCWVESSHKTNARVIFDQNNPNKIGATSYGVCQIQLNTAKHFGYTGTAKQLMNTHTNIYYAGKVLAYWLQRSHGNYRLAVSAYNRGHYKKTMRIGYVCKFLIAVLENR